MTVSPESFQGNKETDAEMDEILYFNDLSDGRSK